MTQCNARLISSNTWPVPAIPGQEGKKRVAIGNDPSNRTHLLPPKLILVPSRIFHRTLASSTEQHQLIAPPPSSNPNPRFFASSRKSRFSHGVCGISEIILLSNWVLLLAGSYRGDNAKAFSRRKNHDRIRFKPPSLQQEIP